MQRLFSIKATLQALLIGVAAAAAFAVSGFVIQSRILVMAFLAPGVLVMSMLGRFIPTSFTYSLFPEGGGPAFFAFSFVLTVVFWVCVFALLFLAARRLRATRKA